MSKQEYMQNICANVRHLRKHHGLSRSAMAHKLGISLKTLDSLESGAVSKCCSVNLLYNICDVFGISFYQCVNTNLEKDCV